jgi:hypothetical protein
MNKAQQRKLVKAIMGPLPMMYGTNTVQRLMGFHAVWHLFDGEAGLRNAGWSRNGIWRSRRDFSRVFGIEVQDAFPEIAETLRALR